MAERDVLKGEEVMEQFTADMPMHHGTSAVFDDFHEHRPCFFTSNRAYAGIYSCKGAGAARILTTTLDVQRPFIGDLDEDVEFYNATFVPWLRSKGSNLYDGMAPIERVEGVPFIWADDFFVHLRRMWRAGDRRYDGMIVDEAGTGNAVGGHGITMVPLWRSQIGSLRT